MTTFWYLFYIINNVLAVTHTSQIQNVPYKTSNIRRTNKIVDHSDVVGASPDGAAPTTSSFST